jgi:DNA-binding CsgD family transcriptional regulator
MIDLNVKLNADLEELVQGIQLLVDTERSTARGAKRNPFVVAGFRSLFKRLCPRLSKNFPEAPDIIYARKVIDFAVAGLNEQVETVIWQEYYKGGSTLAELEELVNYASRTVRRYIVSFAEKMAVQLWEKEMDLATLPVEVIPADTLEQRATRKLEDAFNLSPSQAKILLTYCRHKNIGMKAILELLHISENTLKSHRRHILRAVGAETTNVAVDKALVVLKRELGEDWTKLSAN